MLLARHGAGARKRKKKMGTIVFSPVAEERTVR
jgi:hypothetical protein